VALADRSGDPVGKDEVEALLATRAELGPSYDVELAESFADRVEQVVQARVLAQTGRGEADRRAAREAEHAAGVRQMVVAIVSLGVAIPITIPLAVTDNLTALLIAWIGIVLVNLAHALHGRDRRR